MLNRRGKDTVRSIAIACLVSVILVLGQMGIYCPGVTAATPVADAGNDQESTKTSLFAGDVVLDGSVSSDTGDDNLVLEWYGPFGSTTGTSPSVQIPQGTYTVSLRAVGCPESSGIATAEITITPAFAIAARPKKDVVQLTWTHISGMIRYDVYRSSENDPFSFEKIAETTSTYSTYLDEDVINETNYLYAVAAIDSDGVAYYSNIVASCPPATRSTARLNRPPLIYSPALISGTAGMIYEYTVLAADANNGDILSYSLTEAPSGMTIDDATGKIRWTPTEVGSFQVNITAADGNGLYDSQSFNIAISAPAPTVELVAQPGIIMPGQAGQDSSTLSWCSTNADFCTIAPDVGQVNPIGNVAVQPTETTEYTITAHGLGGTATDNVTVTVNPPVMPPPSVDILANPQAISHGDTSQLYWHSTNAESVTIDQGVGSVALNSDEAPGFGKVVSPPIDTIYTITATGPGGTATDSVTVTVTVLPPTVDISASLELIPLGQPTQLFWHSTHADSVEIDQEIGTVALNSAESDTEIITYPQTTTTYTITATGPGGTATDSVTVNVDTIPPPSVDMIAIPDQLGQGENSWLYWHSTNAETVTIDQNIGAVAANGCFGGEDDGYPGIVSGECSEGKQVAPQTTTTYTITATGPGGTATDSVTVTVSDVPPPTVDMVAIPESIEVGESSWLYWHSSDADTVTIDQSIGSVAANGCYGGDDEGFREGAGEDCGMGEMVRPQATTTYTITATGPGGMATDTVTVHVSEPVPPTVEIVADPETINTGGQSWLYWHSTHAELVSISQNIGVVAANGCYSGEVLGFPLEGGGECGQGVPVSPTVTTTYTITAIGLGGVATDSVTVTVVNVPPPTVTIIANPSAINSGETSWLVWHATNAESVSIDQGVNAYCSGDGGVRNCWDSVNVSPAITTTYTITATGPGGTATASVTVYVDELPPMSVTITANPEEIDVGESSWLEWYATNAETISIDQGVDAYYIDSYGYGGYYSPAVSWNFVPVSPVSTTTYTISATGPDGTVTDAVTVTVDDGGVPSAVFFAEPTYIFRGNSTTLRWQTTHADTVTIDQGIGAVAVNSDENGLVVSPDTTTTYTLTATGPEGQGSISVTVLVLDPLPPLVDFVAWPMSVKLGEKSTLVWGSVSADSLVIENDIGPDIGEVDLNSLIEIVPPTTTTYTISASGPGGSVTESITIQVLPQINISPRELTITAGDSCELSIRTVNGETVSIDHGVGDVQMSAGAEYEHSGSFTVTPLEKTTYTITATGNGGTSTATVTIDVQPKLEFHSDLEIIELGSQAHFHWTTLQADTVEITPDLGELALNSDPGGLVVSPVKKTTYSISACGPTRCTSMYGVSTIYVNDFSKPPVVTYFHASPSTINPGETAKLKWETANMQEARIDNGVGDVPMFGSIEVSPARTTTYTLVVRGPQGLVAEQVTLEVSGTRESGTFGAMYEETIPDSAVDLADDSLSILTGHCNDPDGNPIAGVSVSILGKSEFGEVFTDDQGRYSLPVKGNNRYTVVMAKEGFLAAHRKAEVLNNRIAVLDTLTLIAPDALATVIDFTANPEPVLFHGGRHLVDERGERRLALTIPASETFVEPRSIVTTEYATQAALPAPLPPNTPYTYVAEIGIDQYDDGLTISFHEPAIAWVDNFLGFTIGQRVPVGWYDQNEGQWIPRENGLVVRLLDVDSDGTVDGLDINGDQQADDLDGDGDYADEVAGLPPGEVQVGASYYRFGVDGTGSWALSWPYASMDTPAPTYDLASCPSDACELVEQDIAIPGTEFYLHYSEDRASAYQPIVTIPVTNESVPAHVEAMLVRMSVAGKVYEQERSAEPGQTIQIQWDGMDYLGQAVTGSVTAEIAIGYVYNRNYAHAGGFNHAFSQAGNGDTVIACREKYVAWHRQRIRLDRLTESDDFIADGWTLSAQHQTINSGPASLYLGNGELLLNDRLMRYDSFICGGTKIYNPLTDEDYGEFDDFSGITVSSGGTVFLSDSNFDVIWVYDADRGFDHRFDYDIPSVYAGDYTRHSEILLNDPMGVAIDGSGVYYAESGNHVIRQGVSSLFAGNGQEGYSGDGQGGLGAAFDSPSQLALDHWGNLYIVDQDNHVIRRVSADGIIETIAGNGTDGSDGDNGPALAASISPADIAIDARGNIFIAEPTFSKVRKIDVSGIITTVAGTGARGNAGVGGAAALAQLIQPESVAVNSLGNLYIGDGSRLLEVDGNSLLQETILDPDERIGVMTTDMQDRIFFGSLYGGNVYRVSRPQFADMAEGDFYTFMDSSGQGYHFSALGKHHYTGDLNSRYYGPRHTFVYNLDYLLVSVLDHHGEAILTINRDGAGKVLSLESSEGITSLNVDENNHLVGVLRPDDASATLTYNDQGLLSDFATAFTGSLQGVVTDGVTDLPLGDVTVNLTTNQGSTSLQTAADGSYGFADLEPGEYSLEFHHADYFKQSLTGAIAFGSDPLTHDVAMMFYYKFPPEVVVFKAEPRSIRKGDPYTIFWEVENAYRVEVGKGLWGGRGGGPVGSLVDTGDWTHYYYLSASGPGGETGFYSTLIEVYSSGSPPPWGTIHVAPNVIAPGESATLSWDARYARRVTINNDALNDYPFSGSMTVSPNETTEYVLSVYSEDVLNTNISTYATVLTVTGPPTINVSASPDTISAGESTSLVWSTVRADTVSIDNGIGSVATSGFYEFSPTETTTYTVTATGPEGTATNSVTVTVNQIPQVISFGAAPQVIVTDQSTTLSWTIAHASEVVISGIGIVETSGTRLVTPNQMKSYQLTATGPGGTATATAKVFVYKGQQYDYGDPTPGEQAHLEAINRARSNPAQEAARLGIDLNEGVSPGTISEDPLQPLVCNAKLIQSAQLHTQDMMAQQYWAHDSLDGKKPSDRISDTGYDYRYTGENQALVMDTSPMDEADEVILAHDQLFIDAGVPGRGHRIAILTARFKEVGVGITGGAYLDHPYAYMTTCNFGASLWRAHSFLLGVVYDDINQDGRYTPGEGLGDVEIAIEANDYQTLTATAGGYGLPLPPGEYTVWATLPNGFGVSKQVSIFDQNIKIDFLRSEFSAPPVVSFETDNHIVLTGESATLSWNVTDADTVTIDNGVGQVSAADTRLVTPASTTSYTLTATGAGGRVVQTVTVYIIDPSVAPAAEISASPTSIIAGEEASLSWLVTNADTVSIDNGIGSVDPDGLVVITPGTTTTYNLSASGPGGDTTASLTVTVTHPEPTVSISAAPATINAGESATLSWDATGADTATITPDIGTVGPSGSQSVFPELSTRYTLTAVGPGGTANAEVQVTVIHSVPEISFSAAADTIINGGNVLLSWDVSGADTLSIDNGIGTVDTTGSTQVSPTTTTTYALSATGPGGTATGTLTITVIEPTDPPVVTFQASKEALLAGDAAELSWDVVNAATITIDNAIGNVAATGSVPVTPTETTVYTLTATGPGGTTTESVTISISAISINISAPVDGAVINRPDVMVSGTFTNAGGNETGIIVNGVLAAVHGNEFVANHVPLQEGENTITVTATGDDGDANYASVTVSRELPMEYIRMFATIESGVSPLETTLRVDGTFSFTTVQLSNTGPGTVEFLQSTEVNEFNVRIAHEGIFSFAAEVIQDDITYQAVVVITVIDKTALDTLLQAKWAGLKTALENENIEESLNFISDSAREMFDYNFNLLSGHLAEVSACFHDVSFIRAQEGMAEYNVLCDQDGTTYSFYLLFNKDADGIWRIKFF